MTSITSKFEAFDDEYQNFELIKTKRSQCRDVHAFILLESIFPQSKDKMIDYTNLEYLALNTSLIQIKALTTPQIQELARCGVSFDEEFECLVLMT